MNLNSKHKLNIKPVNNQSQNKLNDYTFLCKLVLKRRIFRLIILSFTITSIIFNLLSSDLNDGFIKLVLSPLNFYKLSFSAATFVFTILPLILLRKYYLIGEFSYCLYMSSVYLILLSKIETTAFITYP